jgi:hypothetical protein
VIRNLRRNTDPLFRCADVSLDEGDVHEMRKARGLGAAQDGLAEGIGSQHANANLAFGAAD